MYMKYKPAYLQQILGLYSYLLAEIAREVLQSKKNHFTLNMPLTCCA